MADFLFRADASPLMGIGHVMRCLAIAEGLRDRGHRCHFASTELAGAAESRLDREGIDRHFLDGDGFAALIHDLRPAALIIDGYHFTEAWRREIRALGRPVLTFQDHADPAPLHADIIINPPGTGTDPAGRAAAPEAIWICGREAILLRRELRLAMALPPLPMAERSAILVGFGGTDPAGLSLPVAAALTERLGPEVRLEIVIGGGVAAAGAVARAVAELGPQIRAHLDPLELGSLMRGSGLAVSAAGGTVGELAALGVPAVIAVVAENQRLGADAAARDDWCRAVPADAAALADAAAMLWHDPPGRAAMAARARDIVDGRGVDRVVDALLGICAKV
jgi:spore coat polysaccharide biosynthesis predicted glycosyltransferase SpsG